MTTEPRYSRYYNYKDRRWELIPERSKPPRPEPEEPSAESGIVVMFQPNEIEGPPINPSPKSGLKKDSPEYKELLRQRLAKARAIRSARLKDTKNRQASLQKVTKRSDNIADG